MLQECTKQLIEGRDLSEAEAQQALEMILNAETPDTAIASFLTALAIKGESPAEVAGFVRVMRKQAVLVHSSHSRLIDTAGTGGGADTFNISTAAAFVIAGAGVPVAKHGNRAMTSRSGSADVLVSLGVKIETSPQVAERSLHEIGLAFFFAPLFHPSMKRLVQIRRELGHRTIFNLLGPLTNPASAPYQIIGVYAPELTEKIGRAQATLGCQRAWVVHSQDGLDELSIGAPSQICQVVESSIETLELDPRALGFERAPSSEFSGGTPDENARLIRSILEGQTKGPARDVVVLNAAAAMHVVDRDDFCDAIGKAQESLDSGAARKKLRELVEAYA